MRAAEFSLLPEDVQMDLLYKSGVYVGKVKQQGYWTVLYQFETFYVEIVYRHYRITIDVINYYLSTDCLDLYLEPVDANEMIQ